MYRRPRVPDAPPRTTQPPEAPPRFSPVRDLPGPATSATPAPVFAPHAYMAEAEAYRKRAAEAPEPIGAAERLQRARMGEGGAAAGATKRVRMITGVEPPHFERVDGNNLGVADAASQPPLEERLRVKKERERDLLFRLMTCPQEDADEVAKWADRAYRCLEESHRAPTDPRYVDPAEIAFIQPAVQAATQSRDLTQLRAFIWIALRTCQRFAQLFCPPPEPGVSRPFLANPAVLTPFIGDDGPLALLVSETVASNQTSEDFVAMCIAHWTMEAPWKHADEWCARDNNSDPDVAAAAPPEPGPRLAITAGPASREPLRLEGAPSGLIIEELP